MTCIVMSRQKRSKVMMMFVIADFEYTCMILLISDTCEYKHKYYHQDETWNDECDYKCTCVDASRGFYRCKDRMRQGTMNVIIKFNVLVLMLVEDFIDVKIVITIRMRHGMMNVIINVLVLMLVEDFIDVKIVITIRMRHGTMHVIINVLVLMLVKDFIDDEAWNDACDYKCTCVDASRGFYRCKDRCVNWNLPMQFCHLDPPLPGTCCKRPICPPFIAISCPEGYKDEYQGIC
ncbi:LOW QUALITY PROTEIN: hypothetical protein KUTeg_019126 [Tegillarca granosa]|uniref:VWFC domain-containing protein n=1 Tax=Tegillarca granosa TaxID=220873 RepID=A0ABQ9EH25_TEGGR|nr:LOW QUALITY PROTEIN: hypothetical protein KUTeg_019126 [Tegillarca granosa]